MCSLYKYNSFFFFRLYLVCFLYAHFMSYETRFCKHAQESRENSIFNIVVIFNYSQRIIKFAEYDMSHFLVSYLGPCQTSTHVVYIVIWYQLFLEFWLVHTWFFAHRHDQRLATRLKNVRQIVGYQFRK